ncbi:hypothetical protein LPJ61_005525 [Coemansia biformis]|uniref:Peptidase S1 domain-containing protein n=1 Tax=Coemansia biformis TaxID=1286918 RepID=A0A9W7Y2Y0_9FUNG|nr:hypothetical protein LPJ61_005525 [Coemansia biformis]
MVSIARARGLAAAVVALAWPGLAAATAGSGQLRVRDVQISDITGFQGTILLINGKQTTCESVLLDSQAGLIAASCLQYTGNNTLNNAVYEVITKTSSDAPTMRYKINKISIHPRYNPSTYINNLAVIQFNNAGSPTWQNYIGINPGEWSDWYFIRRSLSSTSAMTWNNIVGFTSKETPSYCAEASTAYKSNPGDFLCNYAGTISITNNVCKVPYGTVFAAIQPTDLTMVALHSHSAVYGSTMCSSVRKLHYYTLLRNYIGWAASVLGRPVGGFAKDSSYAFTPQQSYSMKTVSSQRISGVTLHSRNHRPIHSRNHSHLRQQQRQYRHPALGQYRNDRRFK